MALLFVSTAALSLGAFGCSTSNSRKGAGGSGGEDDPGWSGTGSGATSSSSGSGGMVGARPPAAAAGAVPGDGTGVTVLAINKLFLGDTDRNGVSNASAWKQYGYNLDGKISTKDATDLCQPPAGGTPASTYPDGDDGIDNAYGKVLIPITPSDPTQSVQESLDKGRFTILFAIDKLGSGKDYHPLSARIYTGADLHASPKWDGTDEWPLIREQLNNPSDKSSAKTQLSNSYLVGNIWVWAGGGTVDLTTYSSGHTTTLRIHNAIITAKLSEDHKSATDGVIAGVIDTEEYIVELKRVAARFDPGLCDDSAFANIANQLRAASDIMADGTQDPNQTCNGISIGLGFEAKLVQLGEVAPAAVPEDDPCAEW